MKVYLSKHVGFCFGVDRAVKTAYELLDKPNINMFGEIVHNSEVVNSLLGKGFKIIDNVEQLKDIAGGYVIIRAHGVSKRVIDEMNKNNMIVVDRTCPKVKRIHSIVSKYHGLGYQIVIVGKSEHPEVIGINGWCDDTAIIVKDADDAKNISIQDKKICVVSQTTYKSDIFNAVVDTLKQSGHRLVEFNTICNATNERQQEAQQIAKQVQCVIVVGGKQSSNTTKLAEICMKLCSNVVHIESAKELDIDTIKGYDRIGIITGASTPKESVDALMGLLEPRP